MNVWGNGKKILVAGLFALGMMSVSTSLTGCLTDDKDDPDTVKTGTALSAEKTDTVWNLQGRNPGAYNLVTGVNVAASAAGTEKDLIDMSVVQGTGVVFPKTLTSGNGTMFVIAASGFDYAAATDSTTIKAYNAGTKAAVTPTLAVGNIVLAKLRGGNRYAAIKILAVTETSSDNLDYIRFGFRLTP